MGYRPIRNHLDSHHFRFLALLTRSSIYWNGSENDVRRGGSRLSEFLFGKASLKEIFEQSADSSEADIAHSCCARA